MIMNLITKWVILAGSVLMLLAGAGDALGYGWSCGAGSCGSYRGGGSPSYSTAWDDPCDAWDYIDEDDFASEWEDEFEDYDDAVDYWEEVMEDLDW